MVGDVKKQIVILGAGFAGLELAARLSETLADEVRVTLLDERESFHFGFSKLDVLFGRRAAADVTLDFGDISMDAVEFRRERVTSIDPERRRVTTDHGTYDADVLAVALGADYDFAATPGFQDGGFEFYSLAGAERLRQMLPGSSPGRSSSRSSAIRSSARRRRSRLRCCCTTCSSSAASGTPPRSG